jgi:CelD/BcsL family acetyltransferase involved in cellulose biosynthesis
MNSNIIVQPISRRDFTGMEHEWSELLSDSASNNVFLTWHWIHTWWEIFHKQKELFILAVKESNLLIGIAPFCIDRNNTFLMPRTIKLCTSEDLYPDYLDIIARNGYEGQVALYLFQYLEKYEKRWHIIYFDNLLPRSTIIKYKKHLTSFCLHTQEFSSACPYVKLNGTYADYMRDHFSRKRRYNLRRQIRIALKDANLNYVVVTDETSLDLAMHELFYLHEKRAFSKNIPSTFVSENVKKFHMTFSKRMMANGALWLCLLCQGERAVSAIYAFKYGGKLLFYQSGMDPAWVGRSVGTVLIVLLMKRAFDEKLTEFDFLKGNEDYKRTFSDDLRRQYKLTFYKKKSPIGIWLFCLSRLKSYMKHLKSTSQ